MPPAAQERELTPTEIITEEANALSLLIRAYHLYIISLTTRHIESGNTAAVTLTKSALEGQIAEQFSILTALLVQAGSTAHVEEALFWFKTIPTDDPALEKIRALSQGLMQQIATPASEQHTTPDTPPSAEGDDTKEVFLEQWDNIIILRDSPILSPANTELVLKKETLVHTLFLAFLKNEGKATHSQLQTVLHAAGHSKIPVAAAVGQLRKKLEKLIPSPVVRINLPEASTRTPSGTTWQLNCKIVHKTHTT